MVVVSPRLVVGLAAHGRTVPSVIAGSGAAVLLMALIAPTLEGEWGLVYGRLVYGSFGWFMWRVMTGPDMAAAAVLWPMMAIAMLMPVLMPGREGAGTRVGRARVCVLLLAPVMMVAPAVVWRFCFVLAEVGRRELVFDDRSAPGWAFSPVFGVLGSRVWLVVGAGWLGWCVVSAMRELERMEFGVEGRCRWCGYSMAGLGVGRVCPECGGRP